MEKAPAACRLPAIDLPRRRDPSANLPPNSRSLTKAGTSTQTPTIYLFESSRLSISVETINPQSEEKAYDNQRSKRSLAVQKIRGCAANYAREIRPPFHNATKRVAMAGTSSSTWQSEWTSKILSKTQTLLELVAMPFLGPYRGPSWMERGN